MEQMLVTVVVPVYNVERYLDRCMDSLANQTYQNLDILLVDDGSPDNCPRLCEEWAQKDSRVRVIHKVNAGLGMARNTGIENAKGQYICFIDSDDYVAPNMIETAYKAMVENQSDIVVFGATTVDGAGSVLASNVPEQCVYEAEAVQNQFLLKLMGADPATGEEAHIPFSAWSCLFSMELIERVRWRFVSEREIVSEDIYSLLALYKDVRKVVILGESFYFYCQNDGSLTKSYRADRYEKNRYFYLRCVELCKKCGYSEQVVRQSMEPFLSNIIGVLKQEAAHFSKPRDAVNRLKTIIDDDVLQQVVWMKKKDKSNLKKYLLYWSIRHKFYWLCYAFLVARNAT